MSPVVGITVGDLAGVGPELVLATWRELPTGARYVVYGDASWLSAAANSLNSELRIASVESPDGATEPGDTVPVISAAPMPDSPGEYPWGVGPLGGDADEENREALEMSGAIGRLQHDALVCSIRDALDEKIAAIVTAPWNKARLADAGLEPTGHTEVLARECNADRVVMVLAGDVLRVALATVHVPLREVVNVLTPHRLRRTVDTLDQGLRELFGIEEPTIAVCGLNPHAGEGGVMGTEERDWIEKLIDSMKLEGFDVTGPHPADTLFAQVAHGRVRADGIVALYHDQGLGPLKTFHFGEAANCTFGLPIIRTSVDHGTAYDIAGTGRVDTSSFRYAVGAAIAQVAARNRSSVR